MSSNSQIKPLILYLAVSACLAPAVSLAHIPIPPKERVDIGRRMVETPVPDFELTDQDGQLFRFGAARGKVILVTFIFTACPDVCPLLTAKFAAIQRTLAAEQVNDYLLLTVTTDPERDGATVLKDYAARFNADLRHWSFLTGSRGALAKVWKIFRVNVTKTRSGDVNHTVLTTLVGRSGNRRVDYYGDKWREELVLKDMAWLASHK